MLKAPWTEEQVQQLNAYQACGFFHPYTCGKRDQHKVESFLGVRTTQGTSAGLDTVADEILEGVLIATTEGWKCPYCDYTQDWAREQALDALPNYLSFHFLGLDLGSGKHT